MRPASSAHSVCWGIARSHIQTAKKRPFHSLRTSNGDKAEAILRAERKVWREASAEVRIFRSGMGVSHDQGNAMRCDSMRRAGMQTYRSRRGS